MWTKIDNNDVCKYCRKNILTKNKSLFEYIYGCSIRAQKEGIV